MYRNSKKGDASESPTALHFVEECRGVIEVDAGKCTSTRRRDRELHSGPARSRPGTGQYQT
jgi:hypothetical protein